MRSNIKKMSTIKTQHVPTSQIGQYAPTSVLHAVHLPSSNHHPTPWSHSMCATVLSTGAVQGQIQDVH